jgi:hypothetical protein
MEVVAGDGGFSLALGFGAGAKNWNSQFGQTIKTNVSIALVKPVTERSSKHQCRPLQLAPRKPTHHPIPSQPECISVSHLPSPISATMTSLRNTSYCAPAPSASIQTAPISKHRARPTNSLLHVGQTRPGQARLRPKEGAAEPSPPTAARGDAQPGTDACACACGLPHVVPALRAPRGTLGLEGFEMAFGSGAGDVAHSKDDGMESW